jgi:hypothetical protein
VTDSGNARSHAFDHREAALTIGSAGTISNRYEVGGELHEGIERAKQDFGTSVILGRKILEREGRLGRRPTLEQDVFDAGNDNLGKEIEWSNQKFIRSLKVTI